MKEPKEEAERIIEMYYDTLDWNTPKILAVRCALLHVEGIIEEWNSKQHYDYIAAEYITGKVLYWQEVLQIIKDK